MCPGFYDEDHFKSCGYRTKTVERPKWVDA
jgi:hypothetical protein